MRTVLADDIAFWSTTRQAAAVRAREFSVTSYLRDRESIDLARHVANVVGRFEPPPR
jgi:hypothetical protein